MARLGGGRRRAAAAQGKTPGPHESVRRPDVVARRRKTGAPEEHGVLAPTAALPVHAEAPLFAAYKPGAVAAVALGHKRMIGIEPPRVGREGLIAATWLSGAPLVRRQLILEVDLRRDDLVDLTAGRPGLEPGD